MSHGIHLKFSFAVASVLLGLVALTVASPGSAKLPKTKTNLIVPGKSVAGLKLGTSMKQAKKIWKDPDGPQLCAIDVHPNPSGSGLVKYERCVYEITASGANYHTGNIYFIGKSNKKTVAIGVNAPQGESGPIFNSQMNRYKTKQGVGIGSSLGKLKSIYKQKLKRIASNGGYSFYKVKGPGKSSTQFDLSGSRVYSIEVRGPKAP